MSAPTPTLSTAEARPFFPVDASELVSKWIITRNAVGTRTVSLVTAARPALASSTSPHANEPMAGSTILSLDDATYPGNNIDSLITEVRSELSSGFTLATKDEVATWIVKAERRNLTVERVGRYDPALFMVAFVGALLSWTTGLGMAYVQEVSQYSGWPLAVILLGTSAWVIGTVAVSLWVGRIAKNWRTEASARFARDAAVFAKDLS